MAKKELTQKEKQAQLNTWKCQLEGLARFVAATPDLEDYQEEDWIWVKGDTKPHKEELKFYGLKFCGREDSPHYQHWYLAAPRWYTEERRERERAAMEASAVETAMSILNVLVDGIESLELDCDGEVYEGLLELGAALELAR